MIWAGLHHGPCISGIGAPGLLLHSLRLRRREVRISAVYLWEELRERRSTFGMSKLLRSLLLLLQILGIAGLTLGLADPFARLPSTKEGDIVLVLDASASMRSMSKVGALRPGSRACPGLGAAFTPEE